MAERKSEKPKKNIPTIYPAGFTLRTTAERKDITFLDFIDLDYDNKPNVVGSFALDISVVKDLYDAVQKVLKKEKWNIKQLM